MPDTGSAKKPTKVGPLYTHGLSPRVIDDVVRSFKVRKVRAGLFEVIYPKHSSGRPRRICEGATREEALEGARKIVQRRAKLAVLYQEFVRTVLLRDLEVSETGQRWLLTESEFRRFLARIRARKLGLFGIEAWRLTGGGRNQAYRFETLDLASLHDTSPSDSEWYEVAFKKLSKGRADRLYYASVDVPRPALERFETRHGTPQKR